MGDDLRSAAIEEAETLRERAAREVRERHERAEAAAQATAERERREDEALLAGAAEATERAFGSRDYSYRLWRRPSYTMDSRTQDGYRNTPGVVRIEVEDLVLYAYKQVMQDWTWRLASGDGGPPPDERYAFSDLAGLGLALQEREHAGG